MRFWSHEARECGQSGEQSPLEPLSVPTHSPLGLLVSFFAVLLGFSLIWHIWWLAFVGLAGAVAVCLRHAWRIDLEDLVSIAEIAAHERKHQTQVSP